MKVKYFSRHTKSESIQHQQTHTIRNVKERRGLEIVIYGYIFMIFSYYLNLSKV